MLCTLTAGAKRRVEGDVAEQVEGIGVRLLGGFGKVIEADATLGQALDDFGSPHGVGPLRPQGRGVRAQGANGLGGVVGVADDPQLLAVRVDVIDEVRRDLDVAPVEVELAVFLGRRLLDLRPRRTLRLLRRASC